MANIIAKLADDKYVEWSTIVDAPVTHIMTRTGMIEYLDEMNGLREHDNTIDRMARAEKYGTSLHCPTSIKELLKHNRAGNKETTISLKKILELYKDG